ncbi:iron donor protein CyaY [Sansalvadorimonas verongulae]|uniref:iron donor protein CyaY n=1 Tax=Sansalvadorimonas verongulae TaxID=2172824 RepID=UPI0012BB8A5B|nr:iron donor protein CyaY [Sansalvadorimonas verongulae]MTI14419.1 iron donor protein CyaY [Sansalvadorimonas verongulae]
MTEFEFNDQLDDLMMAIEDAIEDIDTDIDYENAAGILTLRFDNGTQIILSRQGALRQLWMAARSGGFHFDFNDEREQWICDSNGEEFVKLLNQYASEQAGEPVTLELQ